MAKVNWAEALLLETEVSILIREQERNGIFFDIGKAHYFISLLEKMKEEKYNLIRPYLNYEIINLEKNGSWVKKIFLKSGNYNAQILRHFPNNPEVVEGEFSRIEIEEPSISKRGLIIDQLLKMGWKPELFTEKGFPKLTEKGEPVETLEEVGQFGKDLSLWYTYSHRQSQIRGFLPHVREDGRISSWVNTCATNTFRGAHKVVANIPRPKSVFGKEMRSLFRVEEGRRFVGADASGLELRMLAHHMNNKEYIRQILEGDIHIYNMEMARLPDRDSSKVFIYAFL